MPVNQDYRVIPNSGINNFNRKKCKDQTTSSLPLKLTRKKKRKTATYSQLCLMGTVDCLLNNKKGKRITHFEYLLHKNHCYRPFIMVEYFKIVNDIMMRQLILTQEYVNSNLKSLKTQDFSDLIFKFIFIVGNIIDVPFFPASPLRLSFLTLNYL